MTGRILCMFVKLISGLNVLNHAILSDEKQYVYFCNHTSHFDFLALWASFPYRKRKKIRPVAAKDYWEKTALNRYIAHHVIHAVTIQRSGISRHQAEQNPLQAMLEAIEQGSSLIVFPEGTRNTDGMQIQEFKSGLYHLAHRCPDLEFVPTFLNNLNRILPKGEMLAIPMIGTVVFGDPIKILPGESKEAFLKRAKHSIERIRDEYFQ